MSISASRSNIGTSEEMTILEFARRVNELTGNQAGSSTTKRAHQWRPANAPPGYDPRA